MLAVAFLLVGAMLFVVLLFLTPLWLWLNGLL
jgi:hypothetical protein